ncbi:MAG TPA: pyridoxal-dependent decarboxylase [Candidatus Sumerlaeota bacterium]|nr:pyridoxal-dependent decarboxylase [Candidatus Sumerlaeota bacterium]
MNQEKLQRLIETFFICDKEQISQIFTELLSTMEAEELLPPGHLMSRNYETAQNNPEINTLPGNLKDARDAIFPYFWGTDGWYSPLHMENVKGPANYASLIGSIACLLKNPNICVDTYSERSNELEVKAITALANLIYYHLDSPWGVFTMGGTISNIYGGKIGIEKVCPGAMQKGLHGERIAGIVSSTAHYSNATLAGWLGMGTDNLHSIPATARLNMDERALAEKMAELYRQKIKIAFIICTFGSTDAFAVDDIDEIRHTADRLSAEYNQPMPFIHVDAAVGWPLCFLAEYDLDKNPFDVDKSSLPIIRKARENAKKLHSADSVTIDFHKMGWGHYPSSAFIVKRRDDLKYLLRDKAIMPYFSEADYRRDPAVFTLECSRPAIGPYAVIASLNGIGLIGYQMLVINSLEKAFRLKENLSKLDYCLVLNPDTAGSHVAWWVLPKGRDARKILDQIEAGELSAEKQTSYFEEIRRLFEKRNATLKPNVDARLSFTTSMGYCPCNTPLPAWKAVVFNPRTSDENIDRIVKSIEELM